MSESLPAESLSLESDLMTKDSEIRDSSLAESLSSTMAFFFFELPDFAAVCDLESIVRN
jgi:hypothetical protein